MRRRDLLRGLAAIPVAGFFVVRTSQAVAAASDGRQDFDFFLGDWTVSAKRLLHRLTGDKTWEGVTGTTRVRPILQGAGNVDEDEFHMPGGTYVGGMLRLFDAEKNLWTTYGISRDEGAVEAPVSGRFNAGRGEFYGDDQEGGRAIKVRHLYIRISPDSCRWEQAFSVDGGREWETNWIIDFTRMARSAP